MTKRISALLASLLLLTACSSPSASSQTSASSAPVTAVTTTSAATTTGAAFDPTDWDSVVAAAHGTTVTHTGYGGDDALNEWILGPFAQTLKTKYDITLEYVQGMEFINQLAVEKQTGVTRGSYDTMWINGMNFRNLKDQGQLFGPYNQYLPNFKATIDESASDTQYDFTYPIEGFETPFSSAQLILIHDSARTPKAPASARELLEFAKANPGQVTYPSAEHFTGAAFIRTIIYDLVGHEPFLTMAPDKAAVKAAVEPAMAFLRELNPYLWKQGMTFPAELIEIDNMFINGEVELMMSYGPYDVGGKIQKGIYPPTVKAFLFDNGTVGNTSYYAIPFNAPNRAGALVAINEMLSPEMQLAKLEIGEEPAVTDLTKLTSEQREAFAAVDLGPNNLSAQVLADHRLPEYSGAIEQIITQIWLEEVVGKTVGAQ